MADQISVTDYCNETQRRYLRDTRRFDNANNRIHTATANDAIKLLFHFGEIPISNIMWAIPSDSHELNILANGLVSAMTYALQWPREFITAFNEELHQPEVNHPYISSYKTLFVQCESRLIMLLGPRNNDENKRLLNTFRNHTRDFQNTSRQLAKDVARLQTAKIIHDYCSVADQIIDPETLKAVDQIITVTDAVEGFENGQLKNLKTLQTAITSFNNKLALDPLSLKELRKHHEKRENIPEPLKMKVNNTVKTLKSAAQEFFSIAQKELKSLRPSYYRRLVHLFTWILSLSHLVKPAYDKQFQAYGSLKHALSLFEQKGFKEDDSVAKNPTVDPPSQIF